MGYSDVKEIFNDVKQLADKLQSQELNSRILDLQSSMMELASENLDMREKLSKIDDINEIKKNLKKTGDFWVKNEEIKNKITSQTRLEDDVTTYIYCPVCLAKDNKLVSVNNVTKYSTICLICPVCKYWSSNY